MGGRTMNRENLFRGRRPDNGEWVYGSLVKMLVDGRIACCICPIKEVGRANKDVPPMGVLFTLNEDIFLVDRGTVGEYTGQNAACKDSQGQMCRKQQVFEHDILADQNGNILGCVKFTDERGWMVGVEPLYDYTDRYDEKEALIIGNAHSNPELLEECEKQAQMERKRHKKLKAQQIHRGTMTKDEDIREAIIELVRGSGHILNPMEQKAMIGWLKKQGKQPNKVAPKFNVGDFIVSDYCMGKVIELTNDAYLLDSGQGIPFSCEHNAHLWAIQDAQDGDVLVCEGKISKHKYGQEIGIVKKYVGRIGGCDNCFETYCFIDWEGNFRVSEAMGSPNIHPVTTAQRGLLFQKMEEAGYEWDSKKKELKKIESKSAWSEESNSASVPATMMWPVPTKQEWNEEDEEMIDAVIADIQFTQKAHNHEVNQIVYERKIDWLKSLKQRLNGTE